MKISNLLAYPKKTILLLLTDYLVGTDYSTGRKLTKNFQLSDLQALFLSGLNPTLGGNFKVTELVYSGSETTPEGALNSMTTYIVSSYEFLVLSVNGFKWVLKLQNVTVGAGNTVTTNADFIEFPESKLENVGSGISLYKGFNASTKKHEVKSIIASVSTEPISVNANEIKLEIKENLLNTANNVSVYKNFDNTSKKHNIRPFVSNTLNFSVDAISGNEHIRIEIPQTSETLSTIFVNNGYHPAYEDFNIGNEWKGEGTQSRPITDTHIVQPDNSYVVIPNTAIQNALDFYKGISGTFLDPDKAGYIIDIQHNPNIGGYIFNGDFNYSRLKIVNRSYITCTKNTGYLLDMDSANFKYNDNVIITTETNANWNINCGFNNSGNNIATTNYAQGKTLTFRGTGPIYEISNFNSNKFLLNSDPNGTLNNHNDGGLCIIVDGGNLNSRYNGVCKIGGQGSIECSNNGELSSGNLSTPSNNMLKPFVQNGGTFRLFNCTISIGGSNPDIAFEFNPTITFPTGLIGRNIKFSGSAKTWFYKTTDYLANIEINGSSSLYFNGLQLFDSIPLVTKWMVRFRNNVLEDINIDFDIVDFTIGNNISSVNTIGNNIVECLVKYPNRIAAKAVLGENKAFINTNGGDIVNSTWKRDITL